MKRIALLLTLLIPALLSSQSCLPYGITFQTQEQIDNFQTDYPGCTEIEGGVTIHGDDIENLNGLNGLTSIGGYLWIYGTSLTNMNGLNNLTSIQGYFEIGYLQVFGNNLLQNLSGLENLSYIGGGFHIARNDNLTSLDGMESLSEIGGYLSIGFDYSLTVNNKEVYTKCSAGGTRINNIEGLRNLTRAKGIHFYCNYWLTSLSGLENLDSISNLRIGGNGHKNPLLTDISALSNLNPEFITYVEIIDNELLSNCEINSICANLDSEDVYIEIENNATGCNSIEEVEESCSSCLPDGITFATQEKIDNFSIDYPNCTEIEGNVKISGTSITNLNGLSIITSIGGDLMIDHAIGITSLSGLENLNTIGGTLYQYGGSLGTLTGLDNLSLIGGSLVIGNSSLINLTGLNKLVYIGNDLSIKGSENIINLIGLDSLTYLGGNLEIGQFNSGGNEALNSLSGLNNLSHIDGNLSIYRNESLSDLSGLDSLAYIGGDLTIDNSSLKSLKGLGSLTSLNGVEIRHNDSLENLLGLEKINLITGNITLFSNDTLKNLEGLENLSLITGHMHLQNNKCLTNMNGLNSLSSIGGLSLAFNWGLASLEGLEGLTSIEGGLSISGSSLKNMTGLNNLSHIGEFLVIGSFGGGGEDINPNLKDLIGLERLTEIEGWLEINKCDSLTSLQGLDNLTSIGGGLFIIDNPILKSLMNLDNITAGSITDNLYIVENDSLNECEIRSVCDYLVSPSGTVEIRDNASGCNSQQEVEEACASSINEVSALYGIKTQPNPFSTSTTIEYQLTQPESVTITFYNQFGKEVDRIKQKQAQGKQQVIWNAESQPAGIYYFRLEAGEKMASGKLILMK